MSSKKIIGGSIAVAVVVALVAATYLTNGWALIIVLFLMVISFIFMFGASFVDD